MYVQYVFNYSYSVRTMPILWKCQTEAGLRVCTALSTLCLWRSDHEFRRELDERNAQFEAASRERERANEQLAALQVRLQERDALIDRYERGIRYLKRMNVYGASNISGAGASGGRQLPASIQAVLRDLKQKRQKPAVGGAGAAVLVDSKGTPRAPLAAAADAELEQSARLLFVSPQDGSGAVAFPPVQQSQHDAKRAELPLIRLSTHLLKNANGNGNAESGASGSSRAEAEQFEATSSRSLQPVRPPKKHSRRRGAASLPPAPAVTSVSRCMRCGALYRIEDNTRLACRFHPGGRKRVEEYSSIGLKTKARPLGGHNTTHHSTSHSTVLYNTCTV